mmetsp:Transcript_44480/g.69558  ORF Transcript_44480/g.69558 Transcript_44480/m.69558 type:complete len:141 (-) Transcript_44480:1019-1441(-)
MADSFPEKNEFPEFEKVLAAKKDVVGSPVITDQELHELNGPGNCFLACEGHVYNVTEFLDHHPGGRLVLERNGGTDVTSVFRKIGHTEGARIKLSEFYVGDFFMTDDGIKKAAALARTPSLNKGAAVVVTSAKKGLPPPP